MYCFTAGLGSANTILVSNSTSNNVFSIIVVAIVPGVSSHRMKKHLYLCACWLFNKCLEHEFGVYTKEEFQKATSYIS